MRNIFGLAGPQTLIMAAISLTLMLSCHGIQRGGLPQITIQEIPGENRMEVLYDGELFTAYIYPAELTKPVLFPLISSGGITLTRGFPLEPRTGERVDHPHQAGHWLNYGNVNGLDFWNNSGSIPEENRDRYGYIQHEEVVRAEGGRGRGLLEVSARWKNYKDETVLSENTTFVFSSRGDTRVIDRITVLTAQNSEVLFTDNKEGMVAIRVARELELPAGGSPRVLAADGSAAEAGPDYRSGSTGNYLSSEGLAGNDVWGKRARWVMLSGKKEDNDVSLAIIDHPDNPGYPTYWHARDYGLFSANPLGQAEFSEGREVLNFRLLAGESVTFRYRILVHQGPLLATEDLNPLADEFATINPGN